jgi:hypothetical protein
MTGFPLRDTVQASHFTGDGTGKSRDISDFLSKVLELGLKTGPLDF